jgi:hypothetical protein
MAGYRDLVCESFEQQPVCTVAEAGERIFQLTGLRRGPTQVRTFLKDLGMKWQRVRAIPVPQQICPHSPQIVFQQLRQFDCLAVRQVLRPYQETQMT